MQHIIAVSHGTDNLEGRASIALVREQMQAVLDEQSPGTATVHEAYVDVQEPSLDKVAASFAADDTVTIVPILLSTGYHTQVDITEAAEASGVRDIRIARALGPSAALAMLQRQRLEEAGWDGYDDVVMAAAGSSRADGREAVMLQAEVFSTLLSRYVPYGFAAKIDPQIADAVEENRAEYVSSYLLGRGFFQTLLTKLDGAGEHLTICEPLVLPGDTKAARIVAEVALERVAEVSAG
ncbi:sirohydrochlorin chelatase [Rothia endophytica]|uniref:sirohydrochlorin chelatase n=1 Tax=Rothia endophytica TaxID=1324766 RepID=UPI001F3BFCD8|nr:CbiX/SirB N-terminal domain-containing protein [Rothia endophytica]